MKRFAEPLFAVTCPTSIASALVDWTGRLSAVESIIARVLALGSGFVALLIGLAILRRRRYEAEEARMAMCHSCIELSEPPGRCSIPECERPPNCPKKDQSNEPIH